MAKLDGKIALISGGTSGTGAETAKLFQSEGATVVVTGSNERSVEAAKLVLPGIEVLLSDAGNVAATKTLVDQVKTKHGRIDVLFVNAGIAKFMPIAQVDEAFYDGQFNINVKGAFFLDQTRHPGHSGRRRYHPDRFGGRRQWRPGGQFDLRIDQGGTAFVRPHDCQGAHAARYPSEYHQPRPDRHSNP
jgi:NAD(P)-dependent dehydrogenase (short-subunit alcohol dehydrogenase family)